MRLDVIADVTRFHQESIRRAVKTLQRKGYVELGYCNGWLELMSGDVMRFWPTACPTVRLSVEYLSTLKSDQDSDAPDHAARAKRALQQLLGHRCADP